MPDLIAEFLQNAAIHQESAVRALSNGDLGHWCLGATVNVDAARMLAALRALKAIHRPDHHRQPLCAGCVDVWPCQDYRAISAALLGQEGKPDA